MIPPPARHTVVRIPQGWSTVINGHLVGSTDRVTLERVIDLCERHGMTDTDADELELLYALDVGEVPVVVVPRASWFVRWVETWTRGRG